MAFRSLNPCSSRTRPGTGNREPFQPVFARAGRGGNRGTPDRAALLTNPRVTAGGAVVNAARNLGETLALGQISARPTAQGRDHRQSFDAGVLKGVTDTHLVWLP